MPASVIMDAGRLRQVLVNLVGNAVKFTERGGILVALEAELANDKCELAFSITDTGPGMRAADAARIFQEFEQGDSATTRRHDGAGLGLSISRRIVRHLGGDIEVKSRPRKGSTFRFAIAAPVCRPPSAALTKMLSGQSVLVISPGRIEAGAIAATIRATGGDAQFVRTLGDGVEKLRRSRGGNKPYGIVVIDPRISPDPVRSLRRLKKKAGMDPYSIVLLQPGMGERRDAFLVGGFDGFLVRPVRFASLMRVLAKRHDLSSERTPDELLPSERDRLPRFDILLAEDNDINALLVRSVLQKAGQKVNHVANGRLAVAAVRARLAKGKNFDLILMDLHMPEMDGIAAINEIRRLEGRRRAVPSWILTLTADEQLQARLQSEQAGSDGFIAKPVQPAILIGELSRLHNQRNSSARKRAATGASVM